MHSTQQSQILWESIVASAAVAALVTLLVEYLAKPRLEARKERILEKHQRRRAAVQGLRRISNLPQRIDFYRGAEIVSEAPARERTQEALMEAEGLILMAFEILIPRPSFCRQWQYEVGRVVGYLSLTAKNPKNNDLIDLDHITEGLNDFAELFELPSWHWRRRRILMRKIEEVHTEM